MAADEWYRLAFHASPTNQCLFRVSDGLVVDVNEAFTRDSGYDASAVVGRTLAELGFRNLLAFVHDVYANGPVFERELTIQAKSGHLETVRLAGQLIAFDGEPHVLTSSQTITRIKLAEQELLHSLAREKQLSEMKSDFVSIVSHEFRTPLEVIMSSGDILERYFDRLSEDDRRTHLQAIHESVRRMDTLMSEVLLLSTVDAGKMQCTPVLHDLFALCRRIADEMLSATNRRNPIRFSGTPPCGEAMVDESLLRHMLTNLLSNAVKYSDAGIPVEFTAERDGASAVFRIVDTGCGIPVDDQERLFQAFHRAHNVRQVPGTGLGLVIAKRCVQLHGGTMQFESVEGEGTTFTVRLPLFAAGADVS